MDLHHLKSPLSTSRAASATFPLTHGSSVPRPNDQPTADEPFAGRDESLTDQLSSRRLHHWLPHGPDRPTSTNDSLPHADPQSSARQLVEPLRSSGGLKSHHRHKHSKSRELRLPRPMSHLASSASARGLLPTWSGSRDKERESDDGSLAPITQESTRSRWGPNSASGLGTGSRKGSLLDTPEQHERLGPIRRQEIQSMEDLEQVQKRRKQGEEYLRSALASIGTLATDVTRRLDYTYYNLLEKITALNATIGSFQELSDSASTLLNDFDRETAGLDQDIRKQINELKGFEPQIQKADALDERMKKGRQRVEDLGKRLAAVRQEIDSWEQRETEWQSRISRRLRIVWGIVGSAFLVLVLALVLQNWPAISSPQDEARSLPTELATLVNESSTGLAPLSDTWESVLGVHDPESEPASSSWYPSSLADRRQSLEHAQAAPSAMATASARTDSDDAPTDHDPLGLLKQL
ncbi:uncharacterized protein N7482_007663 [Penicillium canariense]|uniref:Uncharacterized protein n=1 Tax=Penicillium canariense TaxID=189055 RepID=A0A9W9HYJ3_9EURO|nr:uncharacterized protein N7482_007663 [Penicillium canariense]KAJ5160659.1 hypothetical protein N7482_007663 [Penicillium canariense]